MDPAIVLFGLGVGILVGTAGMGGGSLMTPLLILVFGIKPVVAVGTDLAYAAVLLWVAAAAHLVSGNVDLALAGTILLGSIPGVWIGSGLAVRLPERGLRPALGVVLLTSGLALLTKAGVEIPAAVLVGVPLLLAVGCAATLRLRGPEVKLA
jgi:uncharacterized membrane protein YfcA